MHVPSTEEQDQKIEELELQLDEKDSEIDRLNSEILELENSTRNLDERRFLVDSHSRRELVEFKAILLENLESMIGMTKESYFESVRRFHGELMHELTRDDDVVRAYQYHKGSRYSMNHPNNRKIHTIGNVAVSLNPGF